MEYKRLEETVFPSDFEISLNPMYPWTPKYVKLTKPSLLNK